MPKREEGKEQGWIYRQSV